jgi:hypothetical protein
MAMAEAACGESQTHREPCPRCPALEARVAELERRLAEAHTPDCEHPEADRFTLKALRLLEDGWGAGWALRPAPVRRQWMSEHPLAYQCLPMVVANQWGWQVLCPTDLVVTWDGRPEPGDLRVEVDPRWAVAIKSQFGRGIVTFSPPWLFRTPPGWDLYAKGPSNRWKPNCVPLEGVIETWWLNYTFTLNWKVVEPGAVEFARGESLGQLVPVPHATFREALASESPINAVEPEAAADLLRWRAERRKVAVEPVPTHRLYLKAEDVEEHLTRVPVPPVVRTWDGPGSTPGG